MRVTRTVTAVLAATAVLFGGVACTDTKKPDAKQTERASVNGTYEGLVAAQPAHTMSFSPTRQTKNFWIDTWDEPGKLAYVYLQNGDGKLLGYFVLEGPPVDKCTSLVPPYEVVTKSDSNGTGMVVVPRPSVDGTWSSGSNCSTFYGKDATTGAYIEYGVGFGINPLLFDQPLPNTNVARISPTSIGDLPK